jgi:hypothetical protein
MPSEGSQMKDLFGNDKVWKEHWVDMPEFVQESQKPFAQIIIRFETEQDLNEFSALIGQKLTPKTKSIWHPFKSHWGKAKKVWTDEF